VFNWVHETVDVKGVDGDWDVYIIKKHPRDHRREEEKSSFNRRLAMIRAEREKINGKEETDKN